ncbi:MAG: Ig-like domain-containing protein [Parabacteroides sp.]|nr:Ig-like domain-containing protein [Parabacteroides sp.]
MKHLYLIYIATFLSLTSLRAQTLEGGFTILGEETVTPTEVQVTAVGGQPFVGTAEVDQLGYGLVETISTANEQSQSNDDGLLTLTLDRTSLSLYEGDNAQLTASYSMEVSNPLLRWSSSDEAVATVEEGRVYAQRRGNAVITVVSANGVYAAECTVSVRSIPDPTPTPDPDPTPTPDPDPVYVTSVELDQSELALTLGDRYTLKATVYPSHADNKAITWRSSDEAVATVEGGTVKAVGAGTATITVRTEDGGHTATCVVTVTDPTGTEAVSGEQVYVKEGILYVELTHAQRFQVISAAGKLLHDAKGMAGQNRLPMQAFPAGIYFVRLESQVVGVVKR